MKTTHLEPRYYNTEGDKGDESKPQLDIPCRTSPIAALFNECPNSFKEEPESEGGGEEGEKAGPECEVAMLAVDGRGPLAVDFLQQKRGIRAC